jgi:hypothetical protein
MFDEKENPNLALRQPSNIKPYIHFARCFTCSMERKIQIFETKNPKEKQAMKKITCTICKKT